METDFGRVRTSSTELKSTLLVEELLDSNRDAFAVGVQEQTESDYEFHAPKGGPGTFDERRILWSICVHVDALRKESETDPGFHCGDCTKMAASCQRCQAEDVFSHGEAMLEEWRKLREKRTLPPLAGRDACVELLAVLLGTEHRCRDYFELLKQSWRISDQEEKKRLEAQADLVGWTTDVEPRYEQWLALSPDEREASKARATEFRRYFDERPVVPGIPWW